MPESRHDFGPVNRIRAEAFGEPGQRTFRVHVANERMAASLWMEKVQLNDLGQAIETWLNRLRSGHTLSEREAPAEPLAFTGDDVASFRVGQLALGFDEREGSFLLLAYSVEDVTEEVTEDTPPTVSCQATAGQFRQLAQEIGKVVNAGRPPCPLCGQPMDRSGHACIRTNGHLKQPIPPVQQDEDENSP